MFNKHRSDTHHTNIFGFLAASLHSENKDKGSETTVDSPTERTRESSVEPHPAASTVDETHNELGVKGYAPSLADELGNYDGDDGNAEDLSGPQADRQTILELLDEEDDDGLAIHHYQAWLAKDVLLQGRIHITKKYMLFAAPLPPPTLEVLKASPLSKKTSRGISGLGRSTYQRRWFVLHMGSLAWYASAAETYFPIGVLPLRHITAIEFDRKRPKKFVLRANNGRAYTFKADSSSAAYDWAKMLQKEVFRARNQGERAAFIRIPLGNVITTDIQSALDATWLLRMRVIVANKDPSHPHHQHRPLIGNYTFSFFGNANMVQAVNKRIQTYTNDFSQHKNVRFKRDHHGREKVDYHRSAFAVVQDEVDHEKSQFTVVSEEVLDTTPPAAFQTMNDYNDVVRGPGFLGEGLSPSSTTASSLHSPRNLSRSNSGTSTPTSRSSRSKLNILPSLNSHLQKLKIDDFIPSPGRLLPSRSSDNLHDPDTGAETPDVSDNEDNADSDYESDRHEKKFFDDGLLPFAPTKVTHKVSFCDNSKEERNVGFEQQSVQDPQLLEDLNANFREHFGLEPGVTLVAEYIANLRKPGNSVAWQGKLFVSNLFLCFRREGIFGGGDWRMIIPLLDVIKVTELKDESSGVEFEVSEPAYGPFKVYFGEEAGRNDFAKTLRNAIKNAHNIDPDEKMNRELKAQHTDSDVEARFLEYSLRSARLATYEPDMTAKLRQRIPPLMFDPTSTEYTEAFLQRPMKSMKFVMMMIGSRGDVQPYIGLCQGLMAEGHKTCIVTHGEFKDWVESYGIEFRELAGDPGKLMEIMIEHGSFSYSFLKDALAHFRQWVDDLMHSSWDVIKDSGADVLIESPSSMIGLHIAEALDIPYFRAFTMPWTRTRTYPQALIQPDQKMGNGYNYFTYVMFERLVWLGISKQCNQWRKKELGLPPSSLDAQRQQDIPFLYCVSPTVLVPPLDQPNWVHTTGYWNVNEHKDHKEPDIDPKLIEFIKNARAEKKPLVYIGFGSIIVTDPEAMTKCVIEGTKEAGVHCVLGRGWSSRSAKSDGDKKKEKEESKIDEPHIFEVESISHQWLFPQVDACVHHGGSGTTGASLSHGKPTIIKPFFGDQFFYGRRVDELGVGVNLKKLTKTGLANALHKCVTDGPMIRQAAVLGEQIRHEHGVEEAVLCIYRELNYARQVTERRRRETAEDAERTIFDPISLLSPKDSKNLNSNILSRPKNYMDNVLPTFGKRKEQCETSCDTDDGEVDCSV